MIRLLIHRVSLRRLVLFIRVPARTMFLKCRQRLVAQLVRCSRTIKNHGLVKMCLDLTKPNRTWMKTKAPERSRVWVPYLRSANLQRCKDQFLNPVLTRSQQHGRSRKARTKSQLKLLKNHAAIICKSTSKPSTPSLIPIRKRSPN